MMTSIAVTESSRRTWARYLSVENIINELHTDPMQYGSVTSVAGSAEARAVVDLVIADDACYAAFLNRLTAQRTAGSAYRLLLTADRSGRQKAALLLAGALDADQSLVSTLITDSPHDSDIVGRVRRALSDALAADPDAAARGDYTPLAEAARSFASDAISTDSLAALEEE